MVTSGQPTHEPSIYLRPKRNSRIYFTYALLPSYFQLYERGFSKRSPWGRANSFSFYRRLRELMRKILQILHPRFTRHWFIQIAIIDASFGDKPHDKADRSRNW